MRWWHKNARRLPLKVRRPVDRAIDSVRYRGRTIDVMDWARLDEFVEQYGDTMRSPAARTSVVRDPRFAWTIHAWLASEAEVSPLVLALRPLDSMVTSRIRGGWIPEEARSWTVGMFAYGIGLVVSAAGQHRLPVHQLLFPLLADLRASSRRSQCPRSGGGHEFLAAFDALRDDSLVHE